jgi:hypothetical protein
MQWYSISQLVFHTGACSLKPMACLSCEEPKRIVVRLLGTSSAQIKQKTLEIASFDNVFLFKHPIYLWPQRACTRRRLHPAQVQSWKLRRCGVPPGVITCPSPLIAPSRSTRTGSRPTRWKTSACASWIHGWLDGEPARESWAETRDSLRRSRPSLFGSRPNTRILLRFITT